MGGGLRNRLCDRIDRAGQARRSRRHRWPPRCRRSPRGITQAAAKSEPKLRWRMTMKLTQILVLATVAMAAPAVSQAQIAGSTLLGASYAELRDVTLGWSAKRQILGHPVYNNTDERIGAVEDIIVRTAKPVPSPIINAGGFLSVAKHNVAIPVSQFQLNGEKLVLPGATKDALKATPAFEYAN